MRVQYSESVLEYFKEIQPAIGPTVEGLRAPWKLFRYDRGEDRYYFEFPMGGGKRAYLSVTSFCSKSLPAPQLANWRGDVGNDFAEMYSAYTAAYGTFMHTQITEIMRTGRGNFEELKEQAFQEAHATGFKQGALEWQDKIVNDVASFMLFVKERNVEVIAAEIMVKSDKYELAGAVDLVCRMDFAKGRINAIVDLKSGQKGFWDSHRLQLHCYRSLWNEQFEEVFPVTHVFNWAPQNIRSKTQYKLENQTEHYFSESVEQRMAIAKTEGWIKPPGAVFELEGEFFVEAFNLSDHLTKKDI